MHLFLFAVYHTLKNSETMTQGVLYLESLLGHHLFNQFVQVILTDHGSEFSAADAIELRLDSSRRTRLYYCDPMQSGQKGSLENNHIELRYILPKEVDLFALGLQSQNNLNLALSHINSCPKEKLNGKSPFELLEFLCPRILTLFVLIKVEFSLSSV